VRSPIVSRLLSRGSAAKIRWMKLKNHVPDFQIRRLPRARCVRPTRGRHTGYSAPASLEEFDASLADLRLLPSESGGCGLAGPGETVPPGRTCCKPSLMTSSPSCSPLVITAVEGVD